MKLGVCYYPEQNPEELWQQDVQAMRELGLKIVRIGEFSWFKMEPKNEEFDWGWLDRILEILHNEGFQVVLSTPTSAPPSWMIHQHPDILPVAENGISKNFGSRRHYCPNNPVFHEYTKRIVTQLALRYGKHPAIIGWQVDNEFGAHNSVRCYCDRCLKNFREWLMDRYKTMTELNNSWGTIFWSQVYSDWSEIYPPNLTVANPNPSQVLDYQRFASDSFIKYQKLQVDILREITENQTITHNPDFDLFELDTHKLGADLDFLSWNSFPTGQAEKLTKKFYAPWDTIPEFSYDVGDPYITGFIHAWVRGAKREPFWIMQQQVGQTNWSEINTGIRGGTVRLWTWHAVASGAETVIYFRWRATRFAQENYQSGLLKHDGSPDLGYKEIANLLPESPVLQQLKEEPLNSPVAILTHFDDLWAIKIQPHRKDYDYLRTVFGYYRALTELGINVDLVPSNADLTDYRLVIAPSLFIVDQKVTDHLEAYVARGGTLIFGTRSGSKNELNMMVNEPLPGMLRALVGGIISDWQSLPDAVQFMLRSEIPGLTGEAGFWTEAIQPDKNEIVNVLVRYLGGPYSGKAALTEHEFGAGSVYYLGFYPNHEQLKALLKYFAQIVCCEGILDLPDGVIVIQRGNHRIAFNFTRNEKTFVMDDQMVTLPPRDIKFFLRDWS
jgi:beta-galactosidase